MTPHDKREVAFAMREYAGLLGIPFDAPERTANQSKMCELRDFIATNMGWSSETTQVTFERWFNWPSTWIIGMDKAKTEWMREILDAAFSRPPTPAYPASSEPEIDR